MKIRSLVLIPLLFLVHGCEADETETPKPGRQMAQGSSDKSESGEDESRAIDEGESGSEEEETLEDQSCEILDAYIALIESNRSCEGDGDCHIIQGHFVDGLGECYYGVHVGLSQEMLNNAAAGWLGPFSECGTGLGLCQALADGEMAYCDGEQCRYP